MFPRDLESKDKPGIKRGPRNSKKTTWLSLSAVFKILPKYSVLVELNSALGINNRFCGGDKSTSGIFSQSVAQLVFIYCKNAIKY